MVHTYLYTNQYTRVECTRIDVDPLKPYNAGNGCTPVSLLRYTAADCLAWTSVAGGSLALINNIIPLKNNILFQK